MRWFNKPDLREGESVLWRARANHSTGGLARGGELDLTETRLIFTPNVLDSMLLAKVWQADLRDIGAVDVAGRNGSPVSGGLRRRLRVSCDDGQHLFVVNDPEDVAERIRGHLPIR